MTRDVADQDARDQIREDLDSTLVVEAAAGTGKTTALVSRIIEVVRTGRGELARLVAVTFTEKAAGELKLRLRGKLEEARSGSRREGDVDAASRLERGLAQLEEAHIGTIHGFCADLLKQRPLQAGVDPLFEVATEDETERLYRLVFHRFLEEKLKNPPPGIRRLLRRQAFREEGPVDELYRAGLKLLELRDFPTRWQVRPFDRESEIDDLVRRALELAEKAKLAANPRDYLFKDFADLIAFSQDVKGQEQVSGKRDYDALEHRLPSLKKFKGLKGKGAYGPGVAREDLIDERDSLKAALADFDQRARADLVAHLQNELSELMTSYDALKEKRGRLDFLDLLARARDLLKDDSETRSELQQSFSHIFVDEFQDTDPLQAEILMLLAADDATESDWRRVRPVPGKLFVVADPKQSIYRFRRADVALYQQVKKLLVRAGAKALYLTASFRSVPAIQELVNAAMSQSMKSTAENHQADYVPLNPVRENIDGQPAAVALPVPRPYGDWGTVTYYAIQRSEPPAVASWIRWLLEESGWKVSSRGDEAPRPVRPSDVCLLFRRFIAAQKSVTQPYVDALQGLDVPHVLVGGRGFHQREEVYAMRVALTAIERPDDELSVFSTLRGPLFSLSDETLFLFRNRHGALHPFRALKEERGEDSSVREALDVLARLHKNRNYRPIAFTIRELLDETRAQAGFALWQAGDQVLANILRLMQIARTFEESGGLSFRGFIEHLDGLADATERIEQPVIEDGVDAVRLMTVHKAKGLEFPVVVLCDITCSLSFGASRHVDPDRKIFAVRFAGGSPWELLDHEHSEAERDLAESLRLLYVAATRARDILVVPVVADEPQERGWVGPILKAIYPPAKNYRFPMVAPGCPRFSADDCVLDRPAKAHTLPGHGIRPGLHKPERGHHTVAWWDPLLFDHAVETKPGLRRHWILKAEHGDDKGEGAREYAEWTARREHLLESGRRESMRVTTVTRLVETEKPEVEDADTIQIAEIEGRNHNRPTGKRFGSLVHEVLARAALDAGSAEIESLARSLGRAFDNTAEEVAAAATAVTKALTHPLVERAKTAAELFRETPLVYRDPEGRLVEGVPDLVFRDTTETEWTIVDFKTDLRPDMVAPAYRNQVALYRLGLTEATGSPAAGWLLFV